MLSFICSYFNFADSHKVKKNYLQFRRSFPYDITTVELALPHQDFFIEDSIKIRVSDENILWQKERCLNIAIENLPSNTDSIAWVDTDIVFDNNNLLRDTYSQLEKHKVVQLFERCYERPTVNPYNNNIGLGKAIADDLDLELPAIGFAWAFRRDVLIEDKLYDWDPVGNSDVLQMLTWLGSWGNAAILDLNMKYRKEFLLWAWDSYEKVQGDIGYVDGIVEHLYHGHHSHRRYRDRNKTLTKHNFIPSKDLRLDKNGIYSMPYKPELTLDIIEYFNDRKDNENT